MAIPKRHTAFKVWIKDIVNSNYVKQEGWDPNYIELRGEQVSRVNVLATVVGKFDAEDGGFSSITLDDGTETIRSKAFGADVDLFKNVKVGQIIRLIGKLKEYNEEVYISPEIIRVVEDPNWIIVQKLELGEPAAEIKEEERAEPEKTESVNEEVEKIENESEVEEITDKMVEESSPSQKMLELIKANDSGGGADMKKVLSEMGLSEEEGKNILVELLKSGDIFEPRKGFLKVLE